MLEVAPPLPAVATQEAEGGGGKDEEGKPEQEAGKRQPELEAGSLREGAAGKEEPEQFVAAAEAAASTAAAAASAVASTPSATATAATAAAPPRQHELGRSRRRARPQQGAAGQHAEAVAPRAAANVADGRGGVVRPACSSALEFAIRWHTHCQNNN